MFTWRDIPIVLTGWAVIFLSALLVQSYEIRYVIGMGVTAAAVIAHHIWDEIREEGGFHFRSPRSRHREAAGKRTATGS